MNEHDQSTHSRFQGLRVAVLAASAGPGAVGGAERFYEGLLQGLLSIGCVAEVVSIPAQEPDFDAIVANYRRCQLMDLGAFDVLISTKAPTYAVRHPRHVLYLVHTIRVFDDMFDASFEPVTPVHRAQRATIHALDTEALGGIKACFAIGHEVADRLLRWRGMQAQVLHPALAIEGLRGGEQGDYFFLPGRLHPWKRVDLVIKAVLSSSLPLKLVIAGTGEAEASLRQIAGGDPRIQFLGRVADDDLKRHYAQCLAVAFTPQREDFGYITLEAFASGKPVVTCTDSGEPTRLVRNGVNGLVVQPHADSVRAALERIFLQRQEAARLGRNGQAFANDLSWSKIAGQLLEAAMSDVSARTQPRLKVTVIDMQPIDPPVGGGRLRLLGLYHGLGEAIDCTYVGSYDWPGEAYRRHRLSPGLEEIDVPLSDMHHDAARQLAAEAGLPSVIDLAFARQAHLSTEYLSAAAAAIESADVVVFSHPWAYPPLRAALKPHQTLIYDSHNVEGFLRAQMLNEDIPAQAEMLRHVVEDELELCRNADQIWACSQADLTRFNRIYRISGEYLRVVPNGVMAFNQPVPTEDAKARSRSRKVRGHWSLVAIFVGSAYGPNVEAAHFIAGPLASALPDVLWVIAGGVGTQLQSDRNNVVLTGALSEEDKREWMLAADFAVNPMFSGSGTNIKMFDFMGMGLPILTTEVGARGIETAGRPAMRVLAPSVEAFISGCQEMRSETHRQALAQSARQCVEDGYAWERISHQAGAMLRARHELGAQSVPLFSVVVPTFERHAQLDQLMLALRAQTERDFEVVVVDQSQIAWPGADRAHGFRLVYFHSPVKGAVRARNTGASLACGRIIAFTDDDCQPTPQWLLNARPYFMNPQVVGVEGLVRSDHLNDPDWRPVTNVGFEGIGFMTANLMVRSECLQLLGGFDLQFDHPHFREDTDFGWRLQALGMVPFAQDVEVFHPAQSRAIERESTASRLRFFEKDALLCAKHPERYRSLFFSEAQFNTSPLFLQVLMEGFAKHEKPVPRWLTDFLSSTRQAGG